LQEKERQLERVDGLTASGVQYPLYPGRRTPVRYATLLYRE
jgi:hypothetical protein